MKTHRAIVAIVLLLCIIVLATLPFLRDLYRVSQVATQFRFESAVQREIAADATHKASVGEILSPKFMVKYDLNSQKYLDAQGYFSPTGTDWANWSLETRAAAILMWNNAPSLSAWRIYRAIRQVDDYYLSNDRTLPVVKVVNACFSQ